MNDNIGITLHAGNSHTVVVCLVTEVTAPENVVVWIGGPLPHYGWYGSMDDCAQSPADAPGE